MDPVSILFGAVVGFLGKTLEEVVRQRLTRATTRESERRNQTRSALEKCYWPGVSLLDEMLDAHPNNVDEKRQMVRDLIRDCQHWMDEVDLEPLWVAASSQAALRDIVYARDLLRDAIKRKEHS